MTRLSMAAIAVFSVVLRRLHTARSTHTPRARRLKSSARFTLRRRATRVSHRNSIAPWRCCTPSSSAPRSRLSIKCSPPTRRVPWLTGESR